MPARGRRAGARSPRRSRRRPGDHGDPLHGANVTQSCVVRGCRPRRPCAPCDSRCPSRFETVRRSRPSVVQSSSTTWPGRRSGRRITRAAARRDRRACERDVGELLVLEAPLGALREPVGSASGSRSRSDTSLRPAEGRASWGHGPASAAGAMTAARTRARARTLRSFPARPSRACRRQATRHARRRREGRRHELADHVGASTRSCRCRAAPPSAPVHARCAAPAARARRASCRRAPSRAPPRRGRPRDPGPGLDGGPGGDARPGPEVEDRGRRPARPGAPIWRKTSAAAAKVAGARVAR